MFFLSLFLILTRVHWVRTPRGGQVQVWVLQAPIWKFACADCGNITEKLKLIHTAIGLVNVDSGTPFTFVAVR